MIDTRSLFPPLGQHLLALLDGLTVDDWARPTRCGAWTVKDVAAHLLQTAYGRLSVHRDGCGPRIAGQAPPDFREILRVINQANAQWVSAWRPVSPGVILEVLRDVEPRLGDFLARLPLLERAPFPVAWAGERESRNWFDIAREYTERWHHQQHIREAVGAPLLLQRELYHPVLQTFLLALPHTFREVPPTPGSAIVVTVGGEAGGTWALRAADGGWHLAEGPASPQAATAGIEIPEDLAWRLFTRAAPAHEAAERVAISGERELAARVLGMVSVMA